MIVINNLEIQDNGQTLAVDVQTEIGSTITSALLWNMTTFKDYSRAINLDYKLEQLTNQEVFEVTAEELQISSFDDIWFIEFQSDYVPEDNCGEFLDPALGITYNLNPYYNCLLNRFLTQTTNECLSSNEVILDDVTLSISLLIDMIEMGIEQGYYLQIIDLLAKVKKLCSIQKCNNCEQTVCTSCSKFKQI